MAVFVGVLWFSRCGAGGWCQCVRSLHLPGFGCFLGAWIRLVVAGLRCKENQGGFVL